MPAPHSVTRRAFTGGTVAAGSLAGIATSAADKSADATNGFVDAHVHVWTPNLARYPLADGFTGDDMQPSSFTAEQLLAACRPLGITRVVLIQMSYYGFDNSYMFDCMAAHPGVFGGVAIVDHESPTVADEMRRQTSLGVRGFRLYADREKAEAWKGSAGIRRMWTTGADENLAMCLLADPDALPAIERTCEAFPKTPVVIDHFARVGMRGPIDTGDLETLLSLARFPKVHVKVSAFYALGRKRPPYDDLEPVIKALRDSFGAERIMWASDNPFQLAEGQGYEESLAVVRDRCGFLTLDERQSILRGTATRLFFG